jgi:hypothetical protein
MIRQVVLIGAGVDTSQDVVASLRGALAQSPGVQQSHLGADLPGSWGGLGLTWDALLSDDAPPVAAQLCGLDVGPLDAVRFLPLHRALPEPGIRGGIKRTLLLRVQSGAPPTAVEQFERDLMAMPAHIPAIRNWCLSRVDLSRVEAGLQASTWTHVWEQEYRTLDGLLKDYHGSPYHWGWVERWFDPEVPGHIVEVRLAHVFKEAEASILAWEGD